MRDGVCSRIFAPPHPLQGAAFYIADGAPQEWGAIESINEV